MWVWWGSAPVRRQTAPRLLRHWLARWSTAARRVVSSTLAVRVCGRLAAAIHSRMPRLMERGNASKLLAAGGLTATRREPELIPVRVQNEPTLDYVNLCNC